MARILVVDDEAPVRDVLGQQLGRAGHDVALASDGQEALRSLREAPADVVILDLIMPEKDGTEALREIRRDFPRTRVIAISGGGVAGPKGYLQIATLLGADRTLTKPFAVKEIHRLIEEVLAERRT
jgi:CheY-like chemotaxis protein